MSKCSKSRWIVEQTIRKSKHAKSRQNRLTYSTVILLLLLLLVDPLNLSTVPGLPVALNEHHIVRPVDDWAGHPPPDRLLGGSRVAGGGPDGGAGQEGAGR